MRDGAPRDAYPGDDAHSDPREESETDASRLRSHPAADEERSDDDRGQTSGRSGTARPDDAGISHPDAPPKLRRLAPAAVPLWRTQLALTTVILAAAVFAAGIWLFDMPHLVLAGATVALGGTAALLYPSARYRAWGYAVRERDVLICKGVVWRTVSIVPHARIQHVDTRRGPLERPLGLARVVIYTAGTQGAVMTIPALTASTADALRDDLAELGGVAEGL